jgi:hemerythrin
MTELVQQIEWSDDLSVGNKKLDGQHKSLIRLINEFGSRDLTSEKMADELDGVIAYAAKHFNAEETVILRKAPEILAHHIELHSAFIEKAYEFADRFNHGEGEALRRDVHAFLCRWLIEHIRTEDQQYNKAPGAGA